MGGAHFPLDAEDGAEFFAEDEAGAEDGDAEEDHGPDAEGAGEEAALAEELMELEDRLGDGKVLLALGEKKGVGHLEHGEGEGKEAAI